MHFGVEADFALRLRYNPEHLSMSPRSRFALAVLFLILLFSCKILAQPNPADRHATASNPEARTARYLDSIRTQPSLLLEFLRAMPKGGDLHNHLSGAIYAEDFIPWAVEDNLCLNRHTFAYVAPPCDAEKNTVPAKEILSDPTLYQQVIDAQSMRSFNGPESGHDHFFATFSKFSLASKEHLGDMLAAVAAQAAADNVSYVELLLTPDRGGAERLASDNKIAFDDNLAAMREKLMNAGLRQVVTDGLHNLDDAEAHMRQVLHCGTSQASPGCNVTLRYQYEVGRGRAPAMVFSQMLLGFELANTDPRMIDINPVMPEDWYIPMHYFDLHMRMISYLHGLYPKVHLSLHAGELWTGVVPPVGLGNHIRRSIEIGNANRIGHGVDVMFEDDPVGLLREMAARKIAVEINLTSNDVILGVRGEQHPFPIYRQFGVPVVICTDDPGVSRSNMTQEYVRAVRDYKLTYPELKQIVRNSLEFSFLQGDSLWTDSTYTHRVAACPGRVTEKPSAACEQFLTHNRRARLQWRLESDFDRFESETCCTIPVSSGPVTSVSVR